MQRILKVLQMLEKAKRSAGRVQQAKLKNRESLQEVRRMLQDVNQMFTAFELGNTVLPGQVGLQ